VNKKTVSTVEDLQALLDPRNPGDQITLTLSRSSTIRDVTLSLIEVE
jgi:S1-C subfamily serine protease